MRNTRFRSAQRAAAALFRITLDMQWIIAQLRCLVSMGALEDAEALYTKHDLDARRPIVGDWDAIQLMRDAIHSDYFQDMEQNEYEKLFFLKPLLRKFGRHLKYLSCSLMDQFFEELVLKARHYVESHGATLHYVSCSNLMTVRNKSELEKKFLNQTAAALRSKGAKNRVNWLQSNPEHMQAIHKSLPHYSLIILLKFVQAQRTWFRQSSWSCPIGKVTI